MHKGVVGAPIPFPIFASCIGGPNMGHAQCLEREETVQHAYLHHNSTFFCFLKTKIAVSGEIFCKYEAANTSLFGV